MFAGVEPPFGTAVVTEGFAAAGTTQATAPEITGLTTIVTSVPPGSGVQLLRAPYYKQTVVNAGANALNVWPRSGQQLFPTAAVNTAISIAPGRSLGVVVQDDGSAYVIFNASSFG
jgi:hypothetical protein